MRLPHRLAALLLFVALCAPLAARAADQCSPLGHLAAYEAAAPDMRAWDVVRLALDSGPTSVAGRTCTQHYTLVESGTAAREPTIHAFYRTALARLGAEILLTEDHLTVARQRQGGRETWWRVGTQDAATDVTMIEVMPHPQTLLPPTERDYAPLGHMPDYVAAPPDSRAFDQRVFQVRESDETHDVTVQGARIEVDYALRDGGAQASDADIQENYRTALAALGAEVLFTDERNTTARLMRDGQPIWIKVWSEEAAINITVIEQGPHRPAMMPPRGNDYAPLGHMPGYVADAPERHTVDEVIFPLQDGDDTREVKVQGARTDLTYAPRAGVMPASDLDIQLNYRAAFADLAAQILFTDATTTVARYAAGGSLVWVKVWSQETTISLSIVQEKAFKNAVRPTPAETLRTTLDSRGRIALFLPFDFDRATLKPEAMPMLAEVARLLRETPRLSLLIENHTDNIGPRARNLALTSARAASVVRALTAAGVDPARLATAGIGAERPVTDNSTSEARARNRRTVLIRQ